MVLKGPFCAPQTISMSIFPQIVSLLLATVLIMYIYTVLVVNKEPVDYPAFWCNGLEVNSQAHLQRCLQEHQSQFKSCQTELKFFGCRSWLFLHHQNLEPAQVNLMALIDGWINSVNVIHIVKSTVAQFLLPPTCRTHPGTTVSTTHHKIMKILK